jgi:NAD(P)-dependent dehydrogenase (short-subunit alcohol dehydrogenase family)
MNATRVWFVTGASTGFGRALVETVIGAGERVIAAARNVETVAEWADRAPDQCRAVALDVTDPASVREGVSRGLAEFGAVDVLVNNAGRGLLGAVEECSDAEVRAAFEVNFFGSLGVLRELLPHFRERKSGHIVQMGAAAAIANYAGFGVYGAAKAAVSAMTESLAQELRPLGVNVTLVEPGPFRTDFIGRSMVRAGRQIAEYGATSGRFGQYLAKIDGKQPGDAHRGAEAIVKLVQSGEAPLRLVLGRYAVEKTRRTFASRERELARYEAMGMAADGGM